MASSKKTYLINNLSERLYTVTLFFKKGINNETFIQHLKKIITDPSITWDDHSFSFLSKESHATLQEKYSSIFLPLRNSKEWSGFVNYKLSFKNFNGAVTLFTIIESYITNSLDTFIDGLKTHLNVLLNRLDPKLVAPFNIEMKDFQLLSYALINDRKLLITVDREVYTLLNLHFANQRKMFQMSKKEQNEKLTSEQFVQSYLFSFTYNKKDYLFKEFLNICKICKNYHFDFNKKKCVAVCINCGTLKDGNHVCKEKRNRCGLCKLYLNRSLKHIPFSPMCEHKKNIHVAMFINTRQNALVQIFQKMNQLPKAASQPFLIMNEDFPLLKQSFNVSGFRASV